MSQAPSAATAAPSTPAISLAPTASASPQGTLAAVPSGHLAMPARFDVELAPGRYWSSPPFEIGFPFMVDQPGWIAGHLGRDFFDIQRDADGAGPKWPQSILAFGLPASIRGDTDVPVAGLTPAEAIAQLRARASLGGSNVTERTLFGRLAVSMDLHAAVESPVFGAAGGTFTIGPELDARFVLVPFEERLLAVIVQGAVGDLEARWQEALPILESVRLP